MHAQNHLLQSVLLRKASLQGDWIRRQGTPEQVLRRTHLPVNIA